MRIQRDAFEEIKKKGEAEEITISISNGAEEMKVETTLDKTNSTYLLANILSQTITTLF